MTFFRKISKIQKKPLSEKRKPMEIGDRIREQKDRFSMIRVSLAGNSRRTGF